MDSPILERLTTRATMIFDIEDRYARERGLRGAHPRPIEPLRFWLVGTVDAAGRHDFYYPFEMVVARNPEGYHLFFGQVIAYGSTQPRRRSFAQGTYVVRVTSELGRIHRVAKPERGIINSLVYQWVEMINVQLTMQNSGVVSMDAPGKLELLPGYMYPFTPSTPVMSGGVGPCTTSPAVGQLGPTLLRGGLHQNNAKGEQGATVSAPGGQFSCTTNSTGQWVIVFAEDPSAQPAVVPPTGQLTVTETLPDGAVFNLPNVCVLRGCETSLLETALRGWVLRNKVPVSGATVRLTAPGLPQPVEVQTAGDGGWVVYLRPNQIVPAVDVTATLLDGSNKAQNVTLHPRSTVVAPTFQFP